jgi:hypothetical protein
MNEVRIQPVLIDAVWPVEQPLIYLRFPHLRAVSALIARSINRWAPIRLSHPNPGYPVADFEAQKYEDAKGGVEENRESECRDGAEKRQHCDADLNKILSYALQESPDPWDGNIDYCRLLVHIYVPVNK